MEITILTGDYVIDDDNEKVLTFTERDQILVDGSRSTQDIIDLVYKTVLHYKNSMQITVNYRVHSYRVGFTISSILLQSNHETEFIKHEIFNYMNKLQKFFEEQTRKIMKFNYETIGENEVLESLDKVTEAMKKPKKIYVNHKDFKSLVYNQRRMHYIPIDGVEKFMGIEIEPKRDVVGIEIEID